MVGLLATLPEVSLPGMGCWCMFRVPRILCLAPLWGFGRISGFWYSGTGVAPGNIPSSWHGFLPGARSVFVHWGSVVLLRTSDVQVFLFCMHSSSWPRPRLGIFEYSMLSFQWLSFRERGWVVLCFRPGLGDGVLWYLPCSSVCGLHCTGPTNARQSQWETVISCAGGQVFLVRLGGVSSAMRAVPVAACCNMKVRSSISYLLLAPDAIMVTGVLALGHETVCFVSLGLIALVLLLRIFFVKNLLSSWWTGVGVALALTLARLLL